LIAEQQKAVKLEMYRQQRMRELGMAPPPLGPMGPGPPPGAGLGPMMRHHPGPGPPMAGMRPLVGPQLVSGPEEVSLISSDDEREEQKTTVGGGSMSHLSHLSHLTHGSGGGVVAVSSDSDECRVISGGEDDLDEDEEDVNNSGLHTDDLINVPDEQGRVLVNLGHTADDEDVFLDEVIAGYVKPHQIGGIRFLYDNLIESTSRFSSSQGFGCILAHSMGLGKTIQLVSFTEVFLRCTPGRHVLSILPVNVIQNWAHEFDQWLPVVGDYPRAFHVHILNDTLKNLQQRAAVIQAWRRDGGVLLMGYELYRQLANKKTRKPRKQKNKPLCIDIEEEDTNKNLLDEIQLALVNPGPDLVICDEGHRIKNSHASISQVLKQIKTKRRVVLTGYPLQNNLMEYWCMVDFVRPNFLGTKTEFSNMFERPIQNGQCIDSTPKDRRLMKHRAHVLHEQLKGFVQRRGHKVLQESLPKKSEHVLFIRMTPIQRQLYSRFMDELISNRCVSNPLKAFAVCCKIWNHPDMLFNFLKKKEQDDLDIEFEEMSKRSLNNGNSRGGGGGLYGVDEYGVGAGSGYGKKDEINYDWAQGLMSEYMPGLVENSYKMEIFLEILEETLSSGDRILVFSQSLLCLNLLEQFLSQRNVTGQEEFWERDYNYFRLDGSTSPLEREKLINTFNYNEQVKLFMVSTRAGSLGINLVGANRVVVFDASWNPCHDTQAVCRVYRYGQYKETHVYRLVTDNSLEKKIYDRQVNKQGMADRVVDEMNPDAHLSSKEVHSLICEEEEDPPVQDYTDKVDDYTDPVLKHVVSHHGHKLTKEPFAHESLLVDKQDDKLSKAEKKLAVRAFKMEKNSRVSYSRPSYSAFYPKGPPPPQLPPLLSSNGYQRGRFLPGLDPMWMPHQGGRPMVPPPLDIEAGLNGLAPPPYTVPLPASAPPPHLYAQMRDRGGPPPPPPMYPTPGPSTLPHHQQIPEEFLLRPPLPQNPPFPPSKSPPSAATGTGPPLQPRPGSLNLTELDQSTQPSSSSSSSPTTATTSAVDALSRQGVGLQPLTVPHDLLIPTAPGEPPISLKAGQNVMVIKTPKGIYLRMDDKIIKIKHPGGLLGPSSGLAKTSNENSSSRHSSSRIVPAPQPPNGSEFVDLADDLADDQAEEIVDHNPIQIEHDHQPPLDGLQGDDTFEIIDDEAE
jgi:RAD54-like protein 2